VSLPSAHLVQANLAWEDKDASRARIERLLDGASIAPGDLIALPEMCETGFSMNIDRTADDGGQSAAWLASLAERHRAWVIGGVTVRGERGKARNRALVYDPHGNEVARYDKIHPFSFGKEAEFFEGGDSFATFDWHAQGRTIRVSPLICYDLRFPEAFRACRGLGAEMFVVIANWPAERAHHWKSLLCARAIENQAFALGVNRAGDDPYLAYSGGSVAFGPRGEALGELGADDGALRVEVDQSVVREWRERFRAWEDAKLALLPRIGPDGRLGRFSGSDGPGG
jgi:predicted amidohydrolase